jgi:hypothetical protein
MPFLQVREYPQGDSLPKGSDYLQQLHGWCRPTRFHARVLQDSNEVKEMVPQNYVPYVYVNAWILWRKHNDDVYMPLADFKIAIADALCKAGKTVTPKRGRSSNGLQQKIDAKERGLAAEMPQADVRQDGFCHYPIW